MTAESARHMAVNVLGRVKTLPQLFPPAGIDYVSIQITAAGSINIFISKTMANTDEMCITFNRVGDTVDEGYLSIVDCYGNEVA